MENLNLIPSQYAAARNHNQQMKLILNLPVRLVSEEQTIDVFPLANDPNFIPRKLNSRFQFEDWIFPTPNELIRFFKPLNENDLLTAADVAAFYHVNIRTVRRWASKGVLHSYHLSSSLTLYKRSELPVVDTYFPIG
jgi:hypothetical protein